MADTPPYIAVVSPADGATDVGRAAVFRFRILDSGDARDVDETSIAISLLSPLTAIVVAGAVQAGVWSDTQIVPWDETSTAVVEIQIQNTSLLAYDTEYSFSVTATDIPGNAVARTLTYRTAADPTYLGLAPSTLETQFGTSFSNPSAETFRSALLDLFTTNTLHAQASELSARRALQVLYRERFEAATSALWPDEVSSYVGPVLNATSATALIAQRREIVRITRLALRGLAHIVPASHVAMVEDTLDRETRPLLAAAGGVTLLGLLCAFRTAGSFA
jgi:hypothetical protein